MCSSKPKENRKGKWRHENKEIKQKTNNKMADLNTNIVINMYSVNVLDMIKRQIVRIHLKRDVLGDLGGSVS